MNTRGYWRPTNSTTYQFVGDLRYSRYGGKLGDPVVDYNDLGYFDPPGGPLVGVGGALEGRIIKRIYVSQEEVYFEVET